MNNDLEDKLEELYWEFDAARKKTPENERMAFKGKMRYFATLYCSALAHEAVSGAKEHTPAPWKVDNSGGMTHIRSAVTDAAVCRVSADHHDANTNLIVAAPELLKSLEEMVAISDRDHEVWNRAKVAIAKARGEI